MVASRAPRQKRHDRKRPDSFAKLLLRVFLPFAFAYFLSYIFRGVNAVIFPYLERDIGITAADLGLLTSAFFLFFALIQPLQGVALDRYGPRKVQTVLLIVAALGSALFGLCTSFAELIVARVLIGIGFAGGLMAAIKVFTLWYPPRQWGLVTGFHMMAGGAGSMAATLPIQWSLSVMSWQGLFFWLAGICLATAAHPLRRRARAPAAGRTGTLREQFRVTGIVLTDGFYWRIQPLLAVQQLAFIGCISLWIGPWLRDVGGIADKDMRADIQLYATAATALGFALSGVIAACVPPRRHQRLRLLPASPACCSPWSAAGSPSLPPANPAAAVDAVRLPRRLPDPVHAGDGRVLPARLCRPRQHQQQPRGLPGDLRRPVGDGQSRRPVAADGDRLRAGRLRLGVRRAVHPAAWLVWRGCCCRGGGRWRRRIWRRQIERRHEVAHLLACRDVAHGERRATPPLPRLRSSRVRPLRNSSL